MCISVYNRLLRDPIAFTCSVNLFPNDLSSRHQIAPEPRMRLAEGFHPPIVLFGQLGPSTKDTVDKNISYRVIVFVSGVCFRNII